MTKHTPAPDPFQMADELSGQPDMKAAERELDEILSRKDRPMTKRTATIEDLFADWKDKDFPADLGRRLASAIKTVDPVDQLDATGCVLAAVLTDQHRLREINAELLAALKAVDAEGKDANKNGDVIIPSEIWDLVQQGIARAEGKDR